MMEMRFASASLVIASLVLSAASAATPQQKPFTMDCQLAGLSLGEQLAGQRWTGDELKGHVVLLGYWGMLSSAANSNSFQKLTKWQQDYQPKGLVIIGINAVNANVSELKRFCRIKSIGYSAVATGGLANATDIYPRDLPHMILLDHTGKCVFRGNVMQGNAFAALQDALRKAPFPAFAGKPPVKLKAISDQLRSGYAPGLAIQDAAKLTNDKDAATADEAKFIVASLTAWGKKQIEWALAFRKEDPAECTARLQKIALSFKGGDIEAQASAVLAALKKDAAYENELAASQLLRKLHAAESKLVPIVSNDGYDTASDKFRKKNAAVLAQILDIAQALKAKYPDVRATIEADDLAKAYGILK